MVGTTEGVNFDANTAALAIGTAATSVAVRLLWTSLTAGETVLEELKVQAVHVVETLGTESCRAVPYLVGLFLVLACIFVKYLVNRLWFDKKLELLQAGQNPEANSTDGVIFPNLSWIDEDYITEHVANLADAYALANGGDGTCHNLMREPLAVSDFATGEWTFRVKSNSPQERHYTVKLKKKQNGVEPRHLREVLTCTCAGWRLCKNVDGKERVCKHAGAVLIGGMREMSSFIRDYQRSTGMMWVLGYSRDPASQRRAVASRRASQTKAWRTAPGMRAAMLHTLLVRSTLMQATCL